MDLGKLKVMLIYALIDYEKNEKTGVEMYK